MSLLLGSIWRAQLTGLGRHSRRYSALPLVYSEEVSRAKADGTPIVALESTIITHGMPYPKNLETAREVEGIIRKRVSFENSYSVQCANGCLRRCKEETTE